MLGVFYTNARNRPKQKHKNRASRQDKENIKYKLM